MGMGSEVSFDEARTEMVNEVERMRDAMMPQTRV